MVMTPDKSRERGKDSSSEMRLGERLRKLRGQRRLTLDQLSRMAGVSKAMLSQIEQDRVNPTIAVMMRIARALELGIAELIDVPSSNHILRIVPGEEDRYTLRPNDSCTIRTLSPLHLEKNIEFYRLALEKGGELHNEGHFPGTEEFLHVSKGRLAVTSGDQTVQLGKEDSVHYRADCPHVIRNAGSGRAEAYMIVRYRSD